MRTGETRTGWRRIEENTNAKTAVATDWDSKQVRHKVLLGVSARQCGPLCELFNCGPQKCMACTSTAAKSRAMHNSGKLLPRAVLVRIFTIYSPF